MKYLLGVLVLVGLVGCSSQQDETKTDERKAGLTIKCLNGVQYYINDQYKRGFMAPKYNRDGTISLCGGDND